VTSAASARARCIDEGMMEPIDLGDLSQCLKKTSFSVAELDCDMNVSSSPSVRVICRNLC
jgi:hypothetical protein